MRSDRKEKKAKKNGTWVEPPASEAVDTHTDVEANSAEAGEENKLESPKMSVPMTIGLLAVVTVVCDIL